MDLDAGVAFAVTQQKIRQQTLDDLRVGATPQVIESLLTDFLLRYRKRHAGVEVHLVEDCGARLPGRLGRGDIDVAVMPAGEDAFAADCFFRFMRWRSCRNTIV